MLLLIGDHPLYFAEVAIAYQRGCSQVPFAFLGFRTQHVAQAGMSALHLTVGRLLEALGGAFVRFQFRHKSSQSVASRQLEIQPYFQIALESLARRTPILLKSTRLKSAKPTSKPARLDPEPRQPQPAPAFLFLSLSLAPASFPASPFAWLPVLVPSRARPPFSSAPGWRAACCL